MTHTGKPIIRYTGARVLILCSVGHLWESYERHEWPPTMLDVKLARLEHTPCNGAVPKARAKGEGDA